LIVSLEDDAGRMYDTARGYFRAVRRLSSSTEDFGFSETMLSILAFEILIKAIRLIETGESKKDGHQYYKIWRALPKTTRDDLLIYAKQRYGPKADFSELKKLLENWQELFSQGRYSYEKYDGMSKKEVRSRGEAWIAPGAETSEADFAFYPLELNALTLACSNFLRKRWHLELNDPEV
jgi:hypothetical protein